MKNILIIVITLLNLNLSAQTSNRSQKSFVFDYEKDFTATQVDSLQDLLQDHYRKTGDEIVVVTTDSFGEDVTIYANQFGINHQLGNANTVFSLTMVLSVKGRMFGEVPNKKLQTVLTTQILDSLKVNGYKELKAHQFFEAIWKECTGLTGFLQVPENREKRPGF